MDYVHNRRQYGTTSVTKLHCVNLETQYENAKPVATQAVKSVRWAVLSVILLR